MKALVLAGAAAAALMLGTMAPATAQGGCGPGGHRGWDGFCRPNYRPYGFYGYGGPRPYGYGYGRPRPYGYGYGWHRPGDWRR